MKYNDDVEDGGLLPQWCEGRPGPQGSRKGGKTGWPPITPSGPHLVNIEGFDDGDVQVPS